MREFFLNKYTPRGGSTIERQMALLPRLVGPNLHVIENSSDWLLEQIPNPLIFRSPNFSIVLLLFPRRSLNIFSKIMNSDRG